MFDLNWADWLVYDMTTKVIREQVDPYAFESLTRYFDVIHWFVSAASLQLGLGVVKLGGVERSEAGGETENK